MQERIVSNFKKCVALSKTTEEQKGYSEVMRSNIDKLTLRISAFNNTFSDRIDKFVDTFETKIRVINETMITEADGVAMQFDKTKSLCKELIEINK